MTATIAHRQERRWMSSVALIVAFAAVLIAVVALAVGALSSDTTPAKPAPVVTQSAATQPSFQCTPRVAFSKC
jgi:hypothetical protein